MPRACRNEMLDKKLPEVNTPAASAWQTFAV